MSAGDPPWDGFDVIVLGSGAAGLTGAITAALGGARVLIIEKAELVGGTTAVSGGGFWVPLNHHMEEVGVDDNREDALAYVRACAGGSGDDWVAVALIDEGHRMVELLEAEAGCEFRAWPPIGGTIDYRPWLPGWRHGGRCLDAGKFASADVGQWAEKIRLGQASAWRMDKLEYYEERLHLVSPQVVSGNVRRWGLPEDGVYPEYLASGAALVGQLLRACLKLNITIRTGVRGRELLTEDGRVVAVRVETDGQLHDARARSGVLLATGGYAQNPELLRLWLTRPVHATCEVESNVGDGHLMGAAVGGQLAGLGDAWWMPQIPVGSHEDGSLNTAGTREERILPHTLIVNRHGRRFVNEALNYYDVVEAFGTNQDGPKNVPAWLVLDEQARSRYAILRDKVTLPNGSTPEWVTKADTLPMLAGKLGIDVSELQRTVERFNGYARVGVDEEFHRGESEWDIAWGDPANKPNPSLGTVERAPFYAVEVQPGALSTKGGLRVTARAEVIAALTGRPIPGLYAAGNCSSGMISQAYPGSGATIGAAMTFGYLAGGELAAAAMS